MCWKVVGTGEGCSGWMGCVLEPSGTKLYPVFEPFLHSNALQLAGGVTAHSLQDAEGVSLTLSFCKLPLHMFHEQQHGVAHVRSALLLPGCGAWRRCDHMAAHLCCQCVCR